MEKIAILMATYNAGKYLEEQINSILKQTYSNFILFIHDDGSTDQTIDIINKYCQENDNVIFIKDDNSFHSVNKNFFFLLNYVKDKPINYFCFSDQDDIWKLDKLEKMIKYCKNIDNSKPFMRHTDATIVDKNNKIISESFNQFADLQMNREDFWSISLNNNAQGSSMLINKKCLDYLENVNVDEIDMYDHYISMISAYYGNQKFINKQFSRYRQHEKNVIGSSKSKRVIDFINPITIKKYLTKTQNKLNMTIHTLEEFNNHANDNKIKEFINCLKSNNLYKKLKMIFKFDLNKNRKFKHLMSVIAFKYK